VHLDAGSAQRRLEADAALARKEAAQMESRYKAERAQWVAEVDMQKIEVGLIIGMTGWARDLRWSVSCQS
jgi:hypothetical protein